MKKGKAAPAEPSTTQPTKVEISVGGLTVAIEAVAPLNTVAKKALELWREADSPNITRGAGTSVGFAMSEPTPGPLLPPELTLPSRLISEGPDDHRRTHRRTHR